MQRAALTILVAISTTLSLSPLAARSQTVTEQCFSVGDVAGQVASWRLHRKTKAEAHAQAAKYYQDAADRQAVDAIIEKIYAQAQAPTPDRANMVFTADCANARAGGAARAASQ